jgi:hypothetical protein
MQEEILNRVPCDKKREVKEVKDWLPKHQPVWLIGLDGTVIAANLLVLWLWGVLSPDLVQSKKLPTLRTFDIFYQNFNRIPIAENKGFFQKKSVDAKVIENISSSEGPVRAFKEAMLSTPQLKGIYRRAKINDFSSTFEFELNINPPEELTPPGLLQFKGTMYFPVNQEAAPVGFWTIYTPISERTQSIIGTKYDQLLDVYDTIPYVITNTGEPYDVLIDKIMREPIVAVSRQQKESTGGGDVKLNNPELPAEAGREPGSSSPHNTGEVINRSPQWKRSYTAYRASELRAMKFSSAEGINRAIELCWEDPDLKGVPRKSPDGITLIVPEEAVELFKAKDEKLEFEVSKVLSRKDIPPQRLAEMRRRHGM